MKQSNEESKTVIKPQQRMTFLAPIKAISDIQSLNLDLNADLANKYQRFNSLVGPKKSPDINSIPAPTPLPVVKKKQKSKHFFLPVREEVILPPEVRNDSILQDRFSSPVALDTRTFHLLNYGLEKIYSNVS